MVAQIVNNILTQINNQPNGQQIKKLLFLKLEAELNASRCSFVEPSEPKKGDSWVEIVN